jgi:pimeloyl-ACP methyl ester carboxylesterase
MLTKSHFLLLAAAAFLPVAHADPTPKVTQPTVILVHGAFADGSSWAKVIPDLEAHGLNVVAVQLPMTSLSDDVAATKRAIDLAKGPIVLVAHSWGGTVITQAGASDKVKALVYIAAFANDVGTNYPDLAKGYPEAPGSASIQVDGAGFARLSEEGIARDFAPDLSAQEQKVIGATQGPIRASSFGEKVTIAAWSTKPSWYVVALNDRMIAPSLEKAMAAKIHAHVTTVRSSHVVMLSHPDAVVKVVEEATKGI